MKLKPLSLLHLLILLSFRSNIFAQEPEIIKDIIESIAEKLPEDYDLLELSEKLQYHLKHPLNLNKANHEELKELIILSPLQINSLLEHIKVNGKLMDLLELQGVNGFDTNIINALLPFVTIKGNNELTDLALKHLISKSNNDLILKYSQLLQTQKGFTDLPGSRYLGTPQKLLLRYKYNYADLVAIAINAKKDAGEYLIKGKTGIDHLSGNLTLFKVGPIKKLVLGDYSLQFGQGITLWCGFSFGKGPDVTSVASKDLGVRPYSSSNEISFFRGLASTTSLNPNIDFSAFISYRKLDASLKENINGEKTLQNISTSGLHRTATELKNQHSLGQFVYGCALQYLKNNLNAGFTAYTSRYEYPFVTGSKLYNKYSFKGKTLTNIGLHYNYTFRNIYFYGELANSITSGWAFLHGAMASLSSKLSAVILYRKYDRNYHNFFSNGIGEATEINNEEGLYTGFNFVPNKHWSFAVYGDYFRFPWLKYRVDSASSGYEVLTQIAYTPHKTFKIIARYKREIKQQNSDAETKLKLLEKVDKQSARIECNWQLNKKIRFVHRLELSGYKKGKANVEIGYLAFQDLNYHPLNSKWSGNIRIAYFNTPSYNSRIYAYENDVLYASGSGIYYNNGVRLFANTRYRLTRNIDCWAKYGISIYKDSKTIGSGLDIIAGNKKSELKVQIRFQF